MWDSCSNIILILSLHFILLLIFKLGTHLVSVRMSVCVHNPGAINN